MLLSMTAQAALLVALGGAAGAVTRYALSLWTLSLLSRSAWAAFPFSTLLINVSGSFMLAFLLTAIGRGVLPPELRLPLGVGFLGAYTTFSTFSVELDGLLLRGEWGRVALYLLGNVGLGMVAALAGRLLALR